MDEREIIDSERASERQHANSLSLDRYLLILKLNTPATWCVVLILNKHLKVLYFFNETWDECIYL